MGNALVDAAYVEGHLSDELIVDLRPEAMYLNGHVPGAVNLDFWNLRTLGEADFPEKLVEQLGSLGARKEEPMVLYCQVGMTSTNAASILESLGFSEIRHYEGGWEDWTSDCLRPIED